MGTAPPTSQQLLRLRQKTLASLAKLSDRDTFSLATSELHSLLLQSLDSATLPTFLSAFASTLSSAPSPSARKHILSLVSTLAKSHPTSLSPHVSSLVPPLLRLVRDPDSSVRAALPSAVASLPIASSDYLDLLVRSFSESLFTEQAPHVRVTAGTCLTAVIEKSCARSWEDGGERLEKVLGKCEKAMRSKGWKGKVGVILVVGSVIGMVRRKEVKGMVESVLACLGSEDWAERKVATEVLLKLLDNEAAGELKKGCVAALEKRRFDKVKAVREVMNQALEAWKQVPDVVSEILPPLRESAASSKENASDGNCRGPPKYSPSANSLGLPMRKKQSPLNQFTPPERSSASTARKRNGCKSSSPALQTVEIAISNFSSSKGGSEADLKERDQSIVPVRKSNENFEVSKSETRRAQYRKSPDENLHKFVGLRSGSRVAPCLDEESHKLAVVGSKSANYLHQSRKDCEDLSMIHRQLLQIEKQQSSMLDLLQKFMGSSQNGMRSLETRVHGLELALDEISFDLAVTSGRMTNGDSTPAGTSCCMLPSDFLSPKFWRKPEGRFSCSSRFTPSLTRSVHSVRFRGDRTCDNEATNAEIQRFRPQGNAGFIVNPLAKIPGVVQ